MWILIFFLREKRSGHTHQTFTYNETRHIKKKKEKKKVFIEYCRQIVFCCQDQVVGDPGSM